MILADELAAKATNDESYLFESVVRGHHIYKTTWTHVLGLMLQVHAEAGNAHDSHAVALMVLLLAHPS